MTWEPKLALKESSFSHVNKTIKVRQLLTLSPELGVVVCDWFISIRYRDGMLQAKATDPDTMALVEGATSGMVTTIELEGEDAVAEWEVGRAIDF